VPSLAPFIEDEADEADDGGADEAVERCPDAFGLGGDGGRRGEVMLDTRQAIRIGLIVNELATNALKHAFPGERGGTIQVRLQRLPTRLVVIVEDDGIGCPEDEQDGLGS
jgi:signal transduction histidine kinase